MAINILLPVDTSSVNKNIFKWLIDRIFSRHQRRSGYSHSIVGEMQISSKPKNSSKSITLEASNCESPALSIVRLFMAAKFHRG